MKIIVFIHLLNNYSGSPAILSSVIRLFVEKGYSVSLITSRTEGFLSDIKGVEYKYISYQWHRSVIITAILLFRSQVELFFKILFLPRKEVCYYLNTIIPFGAALACKITGKKNVYHVHENMQQNKPIYYIAKLVYAICNYKSIFVSGYVKNTALNCQNGIIANNWLDKEFLKRVKIYPTGGRKTILMIASLRKYKGVYDFVDLAQRMSHHKFVLVVNATNKEFNDFQIATKRISNLKIYPTQKDVCPFYEQARILLQLSHPDKCIETFGMTILEAMAYGIPSIVPNVGGPMELVTDGMNGYVINTYCPKDIQEKIEQMFADEQLYMRLSEGALERFGEFNQSEIHDKIEKYINQ